MDDTISRQAAIDAVEKKIRYTDHDEPVVDWNDFVAALCFLPTAEKKGKWLHPYQSHIASECSVCHVQMPISYYFYFCPHCGARMEE